MKKILCYVVEVAVVDVAVCCRYGIFAYPAICLFWLLNLEAKGTSTTNFV